MRLHIALAVTLSAASAGAVLAQPKAEPVVVKAVMKPGLWEISNSIDTAGSPTKRTVTSRACYSAEDVKSLLRIIPQQREFGMKCENRDVKSSGATVTWKVTCAGKDGTLSGSGAMAPADSAYAAQANLELRSGGKASKVAQKISGKWISECK